MVVGTENVQRLAAAALQLVEQVGDIGGKIRAAAVVPDQHPVLVVAQFGGPEPARAVSQFHPAVVVKPLNGIFQRPRFVQAALGKPAVVANAECFQISPYFSSHGDRKSTRLNSSHVAISYAVFCLKKKKNKHTRQGQKQKHTTRV